MSNKITHKLVTFFFIVELIPNGAYTILLLSIITGTMTELL